MSPLQILVIHCRSILFKHCTHISVYQYNLANIVAIIPHSGIDTGVHIQWDNQKAGRSGFMSGSVSLVMLMYMNPQITYQILIVHWRLLQTYTHTRTCVEYKYIHIHTEVEFHCDFEFVPASTCIAVWIILPRHTIQVRLCVQVLHYVYSFQRTSKWWCIFILQGPNSSLVSESIQLLCLVILKM